MSIFEAGMMVCFGVSWPIAAYKTFKSKSVGGKSLSFSCLVFVGYICGLLHKFLYNLDWVVCLYLINMFFLTLDMGLYLRYKKNPVKNT